MEILPHRRTPNLAARALCPARVAVMLALSLAAAGAHAEADAVDLIGTWHVLIHYTDDHAHDPSQLRWDDRVWAFEKKGDRLRWTEYPIVVFRDQSGRFEASGTNRAARVVHGWEPNESQRAQIRSGVEVSDRGRKSKTLRRKGDDWRSTSRATAASASIVGYVENWSIGDPAGRPVFRREDVLGSAQVENLEGVTQYAVTEVTRGGDELRGDFRRDESRRGTFRMLRSGKTKGVEGKRKSDGQRFHEELLGEDFEHALDREESAVREAVAARATGRGEVSSALRTRVRVEVAEAIAVRIAESGRNPADYTREIEGLSEKIESALIDAGRSPREVVEMLKDGRINP